MPNLLNPVPPDPLRLHDSALRPCQAGAEPTEISANMPIKSGHFQIGCYAPAARNRLWRTPMTSTLAEVAPAFVAMAHRIVWCSVATVDASQRPRSRILHPIWEWDDGQLTGWIGTGPTATKRAHLDHQPVCLLQLLGREPRHLHCRMRGRVGLRPGHPRAGLEPVQIGAAAGRLRPGDDPRLGGAGQSVVRRAETQSLAASRYARQCVASRSGRRAHLAERRELVTQRRHSAMFQSSLSQAL